VTFIAWLLDSLGIILIFFVLGLVPSKWVRIGVPALMLFSLFGTVSHSGFQIGLVDTMVVPLVSFALGIVAYEIWRRKRKLTE